MEVQIKEKNEKNKINRKFSFGNLKIKNKIIFGFFIVAIISGLANYFSNSFIVNEFRSVNVAMHRFHNIFALEKKLEIMVENYVESEMEESATDSDFDLMISEIDGEFGKFVQKGGLFLDKDLITRFIDESRNFFEKEYQVVSVHKREIKARNAMVVLQAEEKEKRYAIRDYVTKLSDGDIYTAFLYAEYLGKEMLYQYRDEEHANKWLDGLKKAKETAQSKSIDIPGIDDYYDVASRISESVSLVGSIEAEEKVKVQEFRSTIQDLNTIQDEVSKAVTSQNLKEINTIVVMGVFVFIFILIFFTILSGYIISSFISGPIKELAEFALMAAKGNFRRRMVVESTDEIGQTARAFNLLLDKVEESTEVLEVKVNARTKRLEELSRNLEVQISNKTKELNEKIKELERFNDLAVGRELRMVELKRELEILKQNYGVSDSKRDNKKKNDPEAEALNCWDFWGCEKNVRDLCPAYLSNSGRECWLISAGKCPRSKERGFEDCRKCAWYKKMNNK